MASIDVLRLVRDPFTQIAVTGAVLLSFLAVIFVFALSSSDAGKESNGPMGTFRAYMQFAYGCFMKPHSGDGGQSQQAALESFYKVQASAYDKTRTPLLKGREDMLGLVASQIKQASFQRKPVWIDVSCT